MWPASTLVLSEPTVSKETPPCRSETRLSTLSDAPPVPSSIEKPLAFQKRVASVSRSWFGALTKTSIITSPASVSVMSSILPTWMCLKRTGAPIVIEPPLAARSRTRRPGWSAGVSGGRGRPWKRSCGSPTSLSQKVSM